MESPEKKPIETTEQQEAPKKKPYSPPELVLYGDMTALTKSIGTAGRADGGGPPNNKTA